MHFDPSLYIARGKRDVLVFVPQAMCLDVARDFVRVIGRNVFMILRGDGGESFIFDGRGEALGRSLDRLSANVDAIIAGKPLPHPPRRRRKRPKKKATNGRRRTS